MRPACVLLLVLLGCTAYDPLGVDGDASLARDGGGADASTVDAGEADGGDVDAGGDTDGGHTDAGDPDGGHTDAGEPDGGDSDGGDIGEGCVASTCMTGKCCDGACCRFKPTSGGLTGDFEAGEAIAIDTTPVRFDTTDCDDGPGFGRCNVPLAGAPCVCRVGSLTVTQQGTLRVVGPRPLIVLAAETIVIDGVSRPRRRRD